MAEKQTVDRERAKALLEERWGKPARCPFSGHTDWGMAEDFVELRPYQGGGLGVGGGVYPGVLVVCNGCGYMAMFSAVALGLLSTKGEAESEVSNAER